MNRDGKLNIESSSRMNIAIDAFNNNEAPYIITCGWAYRDDSSITIADAMKKYAANNHKIPYCSIITETKSRDTVGDAVFTKKNIISVKTWRNLLVITSDYHVIRTNEIFTYVYGKQYSIRVRGAITNKKDEQSDNEKKSTNAFHETFLGIKSGDDRSIYKCLCEKHPFYNGIIYAQI